METAAALDEVVAVASAEMPRGEALQYALVDETRALRQVSSFF
jgi:hypothetical protein